MKPFLAIALVTVAALIVAILDGRSPYSNFLVRKVPAVTVVNDRGERVAFQSVSARAYVLFGYTRCHDVCPLQLATLYRTLRRLPPSIRPRVLFVTIDPAHDDAAALRRYLRSWDGVVEGITGDPAAIRRVYEAFTETPEPEAAADHDSEIFAVDAFGEITDASTVRAGGWQIPT
jgi:protein SCO1